MNEAGHDIRGASSRQHITRTGIAFLFACSASALAGAIDCPPGSIPKEAQAHGVSEAWCELESDPSLLHGPYFAWFPNGVLGTEENYVQGAANGKAVYHWPSGARQAEGNYQDGVREGWWHFWDKTGAKAGQVRYKLGRIVAGRLPQWAREWDAEPSGRRPPPQP